MKNSKKIEYKKQQKQVAQLLKSIQSRLTDYDLDETTWGHIGTLEHVSALLNSLDSSLANSQSEPAISSKKWNKNINRYVW